MYTSFRAARDPGNAPLPALLRTCGRVLVVPAQAQIRVRVRRHHEVDVLRFAIVERGHRIEHALEPGMAPA